MAENASSNQINTKHLSIPLIDLTPLTSPSLSTRQACAQEVLSAFTTHGFLYLTSPPGLSSNTINTIFTHSASFFARAQAQKDSLRWTTPRSNRGYVSQGREKTSHSLNASDVAKERLKSGSDLKESMEIGREGVPGCPNQWPDSLDEAGVEFRAVMTDFFVRCRDLHALIMSAIALGLGLEEGYFARYVCKGDNNLRLLHYPPVKKSVFVDNPHQVRAGAHTDYGSITLLWQDGRGGLQVQTAGEGGPWEDVVPVPGTVVVNAGDLLARWSNDRIRSTRHRVVQPPSKPEEDGEDEYPARYSIAYFCNPDYDAVIDALPNTYGNIPSESGYVAKKFTPVLTEDYLVGRLTATY